MLLTRQGAEGPTTLDLQGVAKCHWKTLLHLHTLHVSKIQGSANGMHENKQRYGRRHVTSRNVFFWGGGGGGKNNCLRYYVVKIAAKMVFARFL